MAKEKYMTLSEKDYTKQLRSAFSMGGEQVLVLLLNAVVDELVMWVVDQFMTILKSVLGSSISAKTYEKIEQKLQEKIADEELFVRIFATFNRYMDHYATGTLQAENLVDNFRRWSGITVTWKGERATYQGIKNYMKKLDQVRREIENGSS